MGFFGGLCSVALGRQIVLYRSPKNSLDCLLICIAEFNLNIDIDSTRPNECRVQSLTILGRHDEYAAFMTSHAIVSEMYLVSTYPSNLCSSLVKRRLRSYNSQE